MRQPMGRIKEQAALPVSLVMALCCALAPGASQSRALTDGRSHAMQKAPPRFEDFPARIFKGKPARPLLLSAQARSFRTRLREGAQKGPNFAGHYTIVTWGCGSACQQLAVVDARTGRVYFSKTLSYATYGLDIGSEEAGLKYRLDSKLLILVGTPGEEENLSGTFYYKWENNEFKLIHSVKKTSDSAEPTTARRITLRE